MALTGTKQQSAVPATDICYKSLAISLVESEGQRMPPKNRKKRVTKKKKKKEKRKRTFKPIKYNNQLI